MELPLLGVKVLDFTWAVAGPLAVRYLAQFGATVVHVESATRIDPLRTIPPFKDGLPGAERSGVYANTNAGKLGIALNLARPEARQVALRLAAWADVVVENYSPGVIAGWGLHYDALRAQNPALVMVSSCLNGQTGPQANLSGYGTIGAALAGFGELTGWPDRSPGNPFGAYTDYIPPKLIAVSILAALDHRRRTGEGQYIDLSQVETSMHFLGPAVLDYTVNGRIQRRLGNASTEHAPHGVYPCVGHDRWVAIAITSESQWRGLCAATGFVRWRSDERFATLAARLANRQTLDSELAGWTACREVEEIERILQDAGVPVHRVSSSADAFADPQLQYLGHFVEVEHPELGRMPLEAPSLRLSRTPAPTPAPGPMIGQHNDLVLRGVLQMTDQEIADLAACGALE